MSRQVIPDQNHPDALDETLQIFKESNEALGVEAVRFGSGKQARLLAIPAEAERCRHRGFGPMMPARSQDRSLPARGPRAADGGSLRKPGFILEEDPGALANSVFLFPTSGLFSSTRPERDSALWLVVLVSAPSSSSRLISSRRDRDDNGRR
jgi:hypothetical protein